MVKTVWLLLNYSDAQAQQSQCGCETVQDFLTNVSLINNYDAGGIVPNYIVHEYVCVLKLNC